MNVKKMSSEEVEGGDSTVARTRFICGKGGEGDGKKEGSCQGAT